MKQAIGKYLQYLQSVRNSSPHTILNYGKDLTQFVAYLSPPGEQPPALPKITHQIIREFVGHLHEVGLEKSSIARKLAALRSFFKYCVREGMIKENPARLVPTPKLPKRIPSVLSAEEMNGFLNELAGAGPAAAGGRLPAKKGGRGAAPGSESTGSEGLLLRRLGPQQEGITYFEQRERQHLYEPGDSHWRATGRSAVEAVAPAGRGAADTGEPAQLDQRSGAGAVCAEAADCCAGGVAG